MPIYEGGYKLAPLAHAISRAYRPSTLMLHIDAGIDSSGKSLDPTGDVPDTNNATHGTNNGVVSWAFDGTNDLILFNEDARWRAHSDYTLAVWCDHRTDGREGIISQFTDGTGESKFNWMLDPGGGYHQNPSPTYNYGGNNGSPSTSYYTTDAWHFHACTYDGAHIRFYHPDADSFPDSLEDAWTEDLSGRSHSCAFGSRNDGLAAEFFHGYISMAWYYSVALTTTEIRALFDETKARHGVTTTLFEG